MFPDAEKSVAAFLPILISEFFLLCYYMSEVQIFTYLCFLFENTSTNFHALEADWDQIKHLKVFAGGKKKNKWPIHDYTNFSTSSLTNTRCCSLPNTPSWIRQNPYSLVSSLPDLSGVFSYLCSRKYYNTFIDTGTGLEMTGVSYPLFWSCEIRNCSKIVWTWRKIVTLLPLIQQTSWNWRYFERAWIRMLGWCQDELLNTSARIQTHKSVTGTTWWDSS